MAETDVGSDNPFIRYRHRLDSYEPVRSGRLSDERWVEIVKRFDVAVADVQGHGFRVTPLVDGAPLAVAAGLETELWIKAEPGNVGGSHKARHLFGVAIHLLIDEELGAAPAARLAIASCGNAAMGAGVVAAAMGRPLDVFVPTWADDGIVRRLTDLGASVSRCPRQDGEAGDPAYLRFRDAVAAGARSFSVQGTDTPTTFDGGRTLGWEIAEQLPGGPATAGAPAADPESGRDSLYVQVGGGALATAVSLALPDARLFPVQTEGCAPLRRAWDLLAPSFDFGAAAANPEAYMWPWEQEPHSLATGILDDITYDWLPLLKRTRASGGEPIVVAEPLVERAYAMAHQHTNIPVCATGSSGFAGVLGHPPTSARTIIIFSGLDRTGIEDADRTSTEVN